MNTRCWLGLSIASLGFAVGMAEIRNGPPLLNDGQQILNDQIDPKAFLESAVKAMELRQSRRLSEEEFLQRMQESGVIVLDARSQDRYQQLHVRGAMSFPFTDMSVESLAQKLPDKKAVILIYCNNNFRGNLPQFAIKKAGASLNLSTFTSLYEYGYRNVFELGPVLELHKTRLPLAGTQVSLITQSNL